MSDDLEEMGPIDYLVVEFPGSRMTGEGFPILVDLVDRGIIRLIDFAFFIKGEDGSVAGVNVAELGGGRYDMTVFEGASSGLITRRCRRSKRADRAGGPVGILVYENKWAGPFAAALRARWRAAGCPGPHPGSGPAGALDVAEARPDSSRRPSTPTTTNESERTCPDFYEVWPVWRWSPVTPTAVSNRVSRPPGRPLVPAGTATVRAAAGPATGLRRAAARRSTTRWTTSSRQLKSLADLKAQGVLTDAEFEAQKAKVLAG